MSDITTSTAVIPERYGHYWATVAYHRTDDLRLASTEDGARAVPENGERVLVKVGWLMQDDDPYPGELAFLIDFPMGYGYWLPQRDLTAFELEPNYSAFPPYASTAPEATDMRCACEVDRDNGVTSMCFACTGPVGAAHPAPTAPEVTEEAGA